MSEQFGNDGFVNKREACQILGGIGGSTLYAGMAKEPPEYPRPYRIGANRVGWKRSELRAWCESRQRVEYRSKEAA